MRVLLLNTSVSICLRLAKLPFELEFVVDREVFSLGMSVPRSRGSTLSSPLRRPFSPKLSGLLAKWALEVCQRLHRPSKGADLPLFSPSWTTSEFVGY